MEREMENDGRHSLKWPQSLKDEAKAAGKQEGRSLSWVIRQAVREWLDSRNQGWGQK